MTAVATIASTSPGIGMPSANSDCITLINAFPTIFGTWNIAFFNSLAGDSASANVCCIWSSISTFTCDQTTQRITQLSLPSNALSGHIPDLSNLTALTSLDLSNNNFDGPIPDSLLALTNLQTLNLRSNSLDGSLPDSLGQMTLLRQLRLDSNNFTGKIPPSWASFKYLTIFDVSDNCLEGSLPGLLQVFPNAIYNERICQTEAVPSSSAKTTVASSSSSCDTNDHDEVNNNSTMPSMTSNSAQAAATSPAASSPVSIGRTGLMLLATLVPLLAVVFAAAIYVAIRWPLHVPKSNIEEVREVPKNALSPRKKEPSVKPSEKSSEKHLHPDNLSESSGDDSDPERSAPVEFIPAIPYFTSPKVYDRRISNMSPRATDSMIERPHDLPFLMSSGPSTDDRFNINPFPHPTPIMRHLNRAIEASPLSPMDIADNMESPLHFNIPVNSSHNVPYHKSLLPILPAPLKVNIPLNDLVPPTPQSTYPNILPVLPTPTTPSLGAPSPKVSISARSFPVPKTVATPVIGPTPSMPEFPSADTTATEYLDFMMASQLRTTTPTPSVKNIPWSVPPTPLPPLAHIWSRPSSRPASIKTHDGEGNHVAIGGGPIAVFSPDGEIVTIAGDEHVGSL